MANPPKEFVTIFLFCLFRQGSLLAITLIHFSHKISAMFSPAFQPPKDIFIDLSDVVGGSCFPVFWPPRLTSGSTLKPMLDLARVVS